MQRRLAHSTAAATEQPLVTTGNRALAIPNRDLVALERDLEALRDARRQRLGGDELARRRTALLPRWQQLDRPATSAEIIAQVALLVAAYPNLAKAEAQLFSMTLADDIGSEQPTLYELGQACRLVRKKHEFLSVAVVLQALDHARDKLTPRRRVLLEAPNQPSAAYDYWTYLDASSWANPRAVVAPPLSSPRQPPARRRWSNALGKFASAEEVEREQEEQEEHLKYLRGDA
jgi:hypothetical protein